MTTLQHTFRSILAGLALLLVAPFALADLTGSWSFEVTISGLGGGVANVTLNQADDGSLTGTYAGQLGNTGITGAVEGSSFEFDVATDMGSVTYQGEIQEDGTLTGSLDLGGMASGTFVATRN